MDRRGAMQCKRSHPGKDLRRSWRKMDCRAGEGGLQCNPSWGSDCRMDLRLSNHIAVVTGGASGIGRAIATAFVAEGCRVVVWDADPKVEDDTTGFGALGLQVDVSN